MVGRVGQEGEQQDGAPQHSLSSPAAVPQAAKQPETRRRTGAPPGGQVGQAEQECCGGVLHGVVEDRAGWGLTEDWGGGDHLCFIRRKGKEGTPV